MKQDNKFGMSIESIAYVQMYVGNIFLTKNFLLNALKFDHVASKKNGENINFLMKQGDIHFLLTSSIDKDTSISQHVVEFGDSVKKISFWVHDVDACFASAIKHGAKVVFSPQQKSNVYTASVEIFNSVEHEFLQIGECTKVPGFDYEVNCATKNPMIYNIDHIATCHPRDHIHKLVKFYKDAFGFSENKNEDIYSEESGMHIIIMKSPNGKVKLPLVEPSSEKSPLNIYLKYNKGSGVHHIAFETDDIIDAVQYYEENFGELRKAPQTYYSELKQSFPELEQRINKVSPYGIMLEQDNKGVLFQIFTKPVASRPTLFLEFVQRDKCEGFGTVNIKALYETLEV